MRNTIDRTPVLHDETRPTIAAFAVGAAALSPGDPGVEVVNVLRRLILIEASIDPRGAMGGLRLERGAALGARQSQRKRFSNGRLARHSALERTNTEEAYFVKVDPTTMTQNDIDNGKLIVVIGVAPAKPAEFVIIRIDPRIAIPRECWEAPVLQTWRTTKHSFGLVH